MKRQGPVLIKHLDSTENLILFKPFVPSAQHLISPQNVAPETNIKVTE